MSVPRRKNTVLAEKVVAALVVPAAVAATTTYVLQTMDGDYAIDKFEIAMPGGYTADATNRYTITLQAGATVLATADLTPTGANSTGTLTDNVFVNATLAAAVNGANGDTLKVVLTKNGTAVNIPAGTRLVAHCHQF